MNVNLIIDTRELELIKLFKKEATIPFEIKQLDLGDIWFVDNCSNQPLLIIERKTSKDLSASIKDGRSREQKARLIDLYVKPGKTKVLYLIEEFYTDLGSKNSMPFNTLLSALVNTIVRDNIQVYHTSSLEMSSKFISKLYEKLNEHYSEGLFATQEIDYISKLKLKKKENKNLADSMIFILCQVPHVSRTTAEAIRSKYPSIISLCEAYNSLNHDQKKCEELLAKIPLNSKRKVGKLISSMCYHYLS